MSHLPYRTQLKTLTAEQLAQINDLRALHGDAVFEPTDDALFDIDLAVEASEADIAHWLAHPDERVAAHLIDAVSSTTRVEHWCGGRHVRDVHAQVVAALVARAESEGLVWTALIDRAAEKLIWQIVAREAPLEGVPTPEQQWDRLIPWIEAEREPARLMGLLDFTCQAIPGLVARHGAGLDRDMLIRLTNDDAYVAELAANPHVTGRALEWLVRRVIECRWGETQAVAIEALNRRNVTVSDRVFRTTFLDTAKDAATDPGYRYNPSADLPHRKARRALAQIDGLTREQVESLLIDLRPGSTQAGAWAAIAAHPAADLPLIRKAYEAMEEDGFVQAGMLRDLSQREDVVADPYFREQIRARGDWFTRLAVVDDLSDEEIEGLIREMIRRARPDEIVEMLETPGRRIPPAVVQALLDHSDQKVRLAATCALSNALDTSKRAATRRAARR